MQPDFNSHFNSYELNSAENVNESNSLKNQCQQHLVVKEAKIFHLMIFRTFTQSAHFLIGILSFADLNFLFQKHSCI